MKDHAKVDMRVNTLRLIEKLDEQVQDLKVGGVKIIRQQPDGPHHYDHGIDTEVYMWDYIWRLVPEDVHTQSFVATLDKLYHNINSKEAIRQYPRGMYRELIEFSDKCEKRKSWVESKDGQLNVFGDHNPTQEAAIEDAKRVLQVMVDSFRKEIKAMIRSIYFYENERDETEESFIDEAR